MHLFIKKISAIFIICLLCFSFFSCSDTPVEDETSTEDIEGKFNIYCYSIGAADAFLLYTENSAVLIDTGEEDTDSEVFDYIKKNCDKNLDALIITHFDKDHVGGAVKILKKCQIGKIYRTTYAKDSKEYDDYKAAIEYYEMEETFVTEAIEFELDGATYTIYPPLEESYSESASNNSSLIVTVTYGSKKFLFCGDAEKARIKEFLNTHEEKYDFVKIPYHGRYFKALSQLIQETLPSYAVITSSEEEPEDETTLELLSAYKTKAFLTRENPVLVKCDGENLSVSYCSNE